MDSKKAISSSKGLLQSEELYQYILETSVYPRELEPLRELRMLTATHPRAMMATAPDAGQLMAMLLKLVNAQKTIEVGVFTGYSLLLTALSIPKDGKHGNEGSFDFAFVDADKVNYWNYHERLMKLLKVGGIAVYDNTLWGGTAALPEKSTPENMKAGRQLTIEFNKLLAADSRVQISHASLGDGITICRRIY
ncbi:PREDICTED: probable caffeoyl-CoA O-methyltransferase At4g26220 isoform X3 [Populus euphratica]|uniref:Probable caffeoyl-CoA O-methyltransferase At4g26220 isoform X3 n=1 Tax=Populus euphratica TaxID=75702 RepID=A0AAJ6TDN7_POPEU|nr:PREDICTED: probable caffeoyl-CoA O-methyltransferase At4g26220 isoform X3 [Populus euphratica]